MPTATDVIASLSNAADAADAAFDAAVAANPASDFRELHHAKMKTADAAAAAIGKALSNHASVATAQQELDAVIREINGKLATLKDLAAWLALLNELSSLALQVGRCLA